MQISYPPSGINIRKSNQNLHALYGVSLKKIHSFLCYDTYEQSHKANKRAKRESTICTLQFMKVYENMG